MTGRLSISLTGAIIYTLSMKIILVIAAGGALGAVGRYAVMVGAGQWAGFGFPYGTIVVNIVGSFLLGVLVEIMALVWTPSEEMRVFLVVGVLGAFTTFSNFSFDTVALIQRNELGLAALYVAGSVILSVVGFFAGLTVLRQVLT